MSSNKYFILKVISAQIPGLWKFRLPWYRRTVNTIKRKKTHPSSIVEISFNDVIQKTGVAENTTSPIWNESFLISCSQQPSNHAIVIKIKVDGTCIGKAEINLDELIDKNEKEVSLLPVSKSKSNRNGLIILQLETANLGAAAICSVQNLSRAIQQNSDSSNLSQLVGDVAPDIDNILELVDDIAQLNAYLKLSLGLLTLVGKRISQQLKFNEELEDVKDALSKALTIIINVGDTNAIEYLVSIQDQILEFIIYCSGFIQEYIHHSLIGQAYRKDKKDTIGGFKGKLGELRKELGEALLIQIDKKVDGIDEKVDGIDGKVDGIDEKVDGIDGKVDRVDGKLDEVLERIPKKGILKELKKKLRPMFVTGLEANRSKCMQGTHVQVLRKINSWVRDTSSPSIFLLTGGAGTGKSTIARTIAQEYERKGELGAYMFFIRGKTDPKATSTTITNMVIQTVTYKLARHNPKIAELIYAEIGNDKGPEFPSSETLFNKLLRNPLHLLMSNENTKVDTPILVVLDALDECGGSDAQEELTNFIISKLSSLPSIFRFFITTRPEKGVASLSQSTSPHLCVRGCIDPKSDDCKRDVLEFIKHEMGLLKEKGEIIVEENWPWDENMGRLGDAAGGVFIWASTVIKYITSKKIDQFECLVDLIENSKILIKDLGGLYATVIKDSLDWNDMTKERFSKVFSLILFGRSPMTNEDIDDILGLKSGKTKELLSCLQSLVLYGADGRICVQHTSLYDYLVGCEGEKWYIDPSKEKERIASRCFELMKSQLRFNICDLETSSKFNRDVPNLEKRVDERIHHGLLYACRYWASHLQDAPYSDEILSELDYFAYKQLLYWLEVLSLTGYLYECFEPVLESAVGWVKELARIPNLVIEKNKERHTPSELLSFLEDALHHVFEFIQPISESTPHLYMTFLPLKRSESDVARHYSRDMKEPTVSLLSFNGDQALSISPSGMYLWNVDNGELIKGPFGGDASDLYWVDRRIVVVNKDGTIEEWEAPTCERSYRLPYDTEAIGRVTSVSMDSLKQCYAIGFENGTILMYSPRETFPIATMRLRGHSGKVLVLTFNRSQYAFLASGSEDQSIIVWDVIRHEKKYATLRGHSGPITSLAFTGQGKILVSGSLDGTIRLWDITTSEMLNMFSASGMSGVYSVAGYDKRHVLSGSDDGIIRMWDMEHREIPPKKFVGHMGKVISLSVDYTRGSFVSGSSDGTIRLWDKQREREIVEGSVDVMAASPNGEYLVLGSFFGTVSVWRIETGEQVKGPLEHDYPVTSLSFSPDGSHFASGSIDGTVRIWDLAGYPLRCSIEGQLVWAVCFSPDGKYVASGSGNTIQVWDLESGELALKPFKGHSEPIESICYSPDGNRIVSGSGDKTICIWDASNGTLLLTLQGHSDRISSVKYSRDGSYILSTSEDETVRFWDANNGKPVRETIKVEEGKMVSVHFSLDNTYFIPLSWRFVPRVYDTSTGQLLFEINFIPLAKSLVFLPSSDSKYIKFASLSNEDELIRIYCVDIDSKGVISDAPDKDGPLPGSLVPLAKKIHH
ncbi:WD40 domain containing protein [Pyrrhoderma noxium]|uniref:WD40 domain containing protein n=1 Tax=Pyrrhoderma noxium TaxID=2282107 RepID=A0A286U5M5_9AGAM|nr:WD40 domain containing protein [Pyrrhoderma noxium]